nr:serine hydrolase domain-containing protein [Wenjunlia tyrosinilytica]
MCSDRFSGLRELFAKNLESGADIGASVAVYLDGEPVVDLWGGHLDVQRTRPWERDTITNVWSTTKTMTALAALVLADRGDLDLDAPVYRYWPEFAAAGKESVKVRHLLSHTAGLPNWEKRISVADLYDWDKVTSLLARQAPAWEPGTRSGYHALTFGYLVGEVVRRVTGRTLGTFFAEELARPLGADFHIGLPPEDDHRVAPVISPGGRFGGWLARRLGKTVMGAEQSWTPEWRRAEIPAANGHGNARSVAAVQSVLACAGEARGVRLLSEAGCNRVFEEQSNGKDLVLGMPIRFGIGYALNPLDLPYPVNPRVCFWGGWGGSFVNVDVDARMTVAYVMNRMSGGTMGDERALGLIVAAYTALGD